MIFAVWLSFHQWAGAGPMQWAGFGNYTQLWHSQQFRTVVWNTCWYVAAAVLVVVPLALLIASALNMRGIRGRDFFRLVFFLPVVLSPVMIALVFTIILDKNYGLLNAALHGLFGMPPIDFLGSPVWAKISVIMLVLWRWTGYLVIYFLAGLRNIPAELYEAAELDGARTLNRFRHITIPMLRPVTAFVVITVLIAVAQIFDEPFILTQGGPANASESLAQFIYNQAFVQQQFGYAAAAGIVLFVVVFVISMMLARIFGVGREVGQ
jgi:ABC-type sugar transport system permease subunit